VVMVRKLVHGYSRWLSAKSCHIMTHMRNKIVRIAAERIVA